MTTGAIASPFYYFGRSKTLLNVTRYMKRDAYIPCYNPEFYPHLYHGPYVNEPPAEDEQPLGDSRAIREKRAATGQPSRGRDQRAATKQSGRVTSRPDDGSSSFLDEPTKVPSAPANTEAVAKPPSFDKSTELAPAPADAEVFETYPVDSDLQSSGSPLARPWANIATNQFQTLHVPASYQGSVKRRHSQVEPGEDSQSANPLDQNPARQEQTSHPGSGKRRRVRVEASEEPVSPLSAGSSAVDKDLLFSPPVSPSTYRGLAAQSTSHRVSTRRPAARSQGSKSRVPDHEQQLIKQLVQEQIDLNNYTEDKWKNISGALKTRYNIDRNFISVKNFWSRYGRGKFGLDERKVKNPAKMITSTQNPADRKRAREEKKGPREAAQRQKKRKLKDEEDGTNAAVAGYGYGARGTVSDSIEQAGGSGPTTHPFDQARGSNPVTGYLEQVEGSSAVADPFEQAGGSGSVTHSLNQAGGSGALNYRFELAGGNGTVADPFQQTGGSGTFTDPIDLDNAQGQNETEPEDDNDGTTADVEVLGYGGTDTVTQFSQQAGGSGAVTPPYQQAVVTSSWEVPEDSFDRKVAKLLRDFIDSSGQAPANPFAPAVAAPLGQASANRHFIGSFGQALSGTREPRERAPANPVAPAVAAPSRQAATGSYQQDRANLYRGFIRSWGRDAQDPREPREPPEQAPANPFAPVVPAPSEREIREAEWQAFNDRYERNAAYNSGHFADRR